MPNLVWEILLKFVFELRYTQYVLCLKYQNVAIKHKRDNTTTKLFKKVIWRFIESMCRLLHYSCLFRTFCLSLVTAHYPSQLLVNHINDVEHVSAICLLFHYTVMHEKRVSNSKDKRQEMCKYNFE